MRRWAFPLGLLLAGCSAAPSPELDLLQEAERAFLAGDFERSLAMCAGTLLNTSNPLREQAQALFEPLLIAFDENVLRSMRANHGTGALAMAHHYPYHFWIHPFLAGCRSMRDGDAVGARRRFLASLEAITVLEAEGLFARAVRQEALRRLGELDPSCLRWTAPGRLPYDRRFPIPLKETEPWGSSSCWPSRSPPAPPPRGRTTR